ncbi:MAG: hypothetical protein AAFR61_17630 [Bacteroidota bacterium]
MKYLWVCLVLGLMACKAEPTQVSETSPTLVDSTAFWQHKLARYASFPLVPFQQEVPTAYQAMLPFLEKACKLTDSLFWLQSYGPPGPLLGSTSDTLLRQLYRLNFGPYDRLGANQALRHGLAPKQAGANFYPANLFEAEFSRFTASDKLSPYTLLRRDAQDGQLQVLAYHQAYPLQQAVAAQLEQAAALCPEPGLADFLRARAQALRTDDYLSSDVIWGDLQAPEIDILIGPLEAYEDQLFGLKQAHQSYLLRKDAAATRKYQVLKPYLAQLGQWVPFAPPASSLEEDQLIGYQVLCAGGLFNTGAKSQGLNAPQVQIPGQGRRRIVLTNIAQAKFELIVQPLADMVWDSTQLAWIEPAAYEWLVLFHEIAHGLGLEATQEGEALQLALQEYASILEEGKGDMLGLFLLDTWQAENQLLSLAPEQFYATFMVSMLRSIRFGGSSDHAMANLLRYRHFRDAGALNFDATTTTYSLVPEQMPAAIDSLTRKLLRLQWEGKPQAVKNWIREKGRPDAALEQSLGKLDSLGVPVDLRFE